ncbi:uncharacterized protein OCT59_014888 [Rhizophagus irregularis]|uniref:Uncharacterized protein n=2 Tax=Rhizophagus irregularis TaxID=588596 RepID=A0A2P4QQR5_RHIID|nr:hypothetical protein GLOIN_2v1471977 [Rhizophagus irregularis DAOM 181602=DAOM 197198]POG79984.1 hypothetical protein GLOIN_2v1471977 [Rhizophagus irregularis DAOM 181602=DAOM 197198]UZO22526.1 hypothetical protein OCT59_014888 [Rhizophagus irregularis]GBC43866.2 hypothetical protein GLOIN_2v1471977 [Rhizophagus irregularis DAOM 181602=DAOM 197198]|eukprot:XP_025186850.1 hypothetical protein GLOIN_2v1471977 [Rhizophagus irregularis DAOM 181602=DAOM 197198]
MQNSVDEIMINIFRFVEYPINLILTSRDWLRIAKDPYVKSKWLITKYGKLYALYNAARLGPSFIDISLYKILIARNENASVPIFFFQRLLMHLDKYDQKLIHLKTEDNSGHPYTSYHVYANKSKEDDTKLFHFFAYGTHVVNYGQMISLKDIGSLLPQSASTSGYLSKVDYEIDKFDLFKLLELINFLAQPRPPRMLGVRHGRHNKLDGRHGRQNKLGGRHGRQNKLEGRHGRQNKLGGTIGGSYGGQDNFGGRHGSHVQLGQLVNTNRQPTAPIASFSQQPIADPNDILLVEMIDGSSFF